MPRPNIVTVMADQFAPQFTGTYGHAVARTPHIDELAARGMRFDAVYYNSPLFAPSHVLMMAGELIGRTGAWDNACEFRASAPALAHYLLLLGYRTCPVGKMHFIEPAWWGLYPDDHIEMPASMPLADQQNLLSHCLVDGIEARTVPLADEENRRAYLANVSYFDGKLGEILRTLRETDEPDNTVVIATTDHGDTLGEPVDGRSLMPLAQSEDDSMGVAIIEYCTKMAPCRVFTTRRGQCKYIYCDADPAQLYDQVNDPLETRNLAVGPAHAETAIHGTAPTCGRESSPRSNCAMPCIPRLRPVPARRPQPHRLDGRLQSLPFSTAEG